jgi:hypothetical protein
MTNKKNDVLDGFMKTILNIRKMIPTPFHKKFAIGSAIVLSTLMSLPWAVAACNGQKQTLNISRVNNMKFKFRRL